MRDFKNKIEVFDSINDLEQKNNGLSLFRY